MSAVLQNRLRPTNANEAFALWLAENQPQVFRALVAKANQQGQLHGITDWLTSVGTSMGSAVKSVGRFVASPQGIGALTSVAGVYLQTQAQKDALKIQLAQARAGYAPQPIISNATSQQFPMYVDPTTGQQYPLTSQLSNQLLPQSTVAMLAPWMIGAGVLIVIVATLKGR